MEGLETEILAELGYEDPYLAEKSDLTIIFEISFSKKALLYKKLTVILQINRQFWLKIIVNCFIN